MIEGFSLLLSIGISVTLVLILFGCVCGCRKDAHKSELVGTAGVVKLHSDEEASATSQTSPVSTKRVSNQNQRSLPEIPPPVPRQDSGDTTSDLYATVGTHQRVSEQSSPITTRASEYPYEHAYARLQDGSLRTEDSIINENVAVSSSNNTLPIPLVDATPDESQSSNDAVVITASIAISGQVSSSRDLPYMTPPVTVSSGAHTTATVTSSSDQPAPTPAPVADNNVPLQHFSGDSVDSAKGYTSISVREPLSSIRATIAENQSQPHYATVSDDSDEMYAAIDEPVGSNNQVYTSGSETYAQIQPVNTVRTQVTLHHPPSQPSTSAVVNNVAANVSAVTSSGPSTVSHTTNTDTIHHVTETASSSRQSANESIKQSALAKHSRQASNASCNSSVGTIGSPKPEKRQANSPLPPTPVPSHPETHSTSGAVPQATVPGSSQTSHSHRKREKKESKHRISSTGDLHNNPEKLRRSLNEKHQRNNSCVSSSDFYGCNYPVDKHRYSSGDLVKSLTAKEINFSLDNPGDKQKDAMYNAIDGNDIYAAIDQSPPKSLPNVTSSPSKNVEEMYAKVIKKSRHSQERAHSFAKLLNDDVEAGRVADVNGVKLRKKSFHNNEDRLSGSHFTNIPIHNDAFRNSPSPKNQSIKEDPGYETIDRIRNKNHSYETIDKNVAKHKAADRNSDPGYETVKDPQKFRRIETVSGRVAQHRAIIMEPGYETLPSGPNSIQSNDPGYEHIRGLDRCPSDADPNYEELTTHKAQSSYAVINKSIPAYSVINKKAKVADKDWSLNNNENFSSEPNYESMPNEPFYATGSETDSNYETVGPKDPNYESVKYFDLEKAEPPYEKVRNKGESAKVKRTGSSSSGYERVKTILKRDEDQNDNRTNELMSASGDMAPVGDYFHV